jgi:hypothetical protein
MTLKKYIVKYILINDIYQHVNSIELFAVDENSAKNIVKFTFKEVMKNVKLTSCEEININNK